MTQLAPFSESYDMFIAILFCFIPPFIWFYYGYRASKSGSYYKKQDEKSAVYEWAESDENVPFVKTGQFYIGLLWLVFGSIFFFAFLWPEHHDIWFIQK
jgi:hypothetical protein